MRKSSAICFTALVISLSARSAHASFHIMRISEAMAQFHGDPRIQFVELQMAASDQNFVGGHKVIFQDASGKKAGEVTFTASVANGANGANILVGTQAFATAFGVSVDLLLPEGIMPPFSGRVCWDTIDCLAYGDFTGSNTGFGAPAARFPVDGDRSLTLPNVTPPGAGRDNSKNYELRPPTPRNNASQSGLVPPTSACFVTDNFVNISQWDQPEANAGLDLTNCGVPVAVDIGSAEVSGGKLFLTPGQADQLDLGSPICFTGLSNAAAKKITDPNYRLKLNMVAHRGIGVGAFFTRQKYSFDDVAKTIDVSRSIGLGVNFSVDELNNEQPDHYHPDVRSNCIQDVTRSAVPGERTIHYPEGFLLSSETEYTWILDVDGDDAAGPLTLQVKVFNASEEEPMDYLGTTQAPAGVPSPGAIGDPDLEHGILLTALGLDVGAGQPSMEISKFSICPIPRNQKHVRDLTCVRQGDGTILATWQNPFDAETDKPIRLSVNGGTPTTLAGTATESTITDPPDGEVTISVTNYSSVAATCTVCENNPPDAVISGPDTGELQDGTATIAFDSGASTDGDQGLQTLSRFWDILSAPAGGTASLDDPGAVVVRMNVNADGEYKVRLTITDSGCEGDLGQSDVAEHTVTIGSTPPPGGLQKPGDENQDGKLDLSDAVSVLNHLFLGTNPSLSCGDGTASDPANKQLLDANGDNKVDLSDPVRLLNFLFLGALPPVACAGDTTCPCIRIVGCADACR